MKKHKIIIGVTTAAAVAIPTVVITMQNKDVENNGLYVNNSLSLYQNNSGSKQITTLWGSQDERGKHGKIFQTYDGTLWMASSDNGLQFLKPGEDVWERAYRVKSTIESNRIPSHNGPGYGIVMFEDKDDNFWVMGNGDKGVKLQVLRKGQTDFETISSVTSGEHGTIMEDSDGKIWVTGKDGLYYSDSTKQTFTKDKRSTNNITDGSFSKIFQDTSGRIWAAGNGTPLQVLEKGATVWKAAPGTNNKITSGYSATIFEDSVGNIWTMSENAPLQVLRANATTPTTPTTPTTSITWETPSSGISNGLFGTIFEDKAGNIWAMGDGSKLRVLRSGQTTWEDAGNGNLITDGYGGKILQDKSGNIWAMGKGTGLQVLKKGQTTWENTNNPQGINGSKITDGDNGDIFEDKLGNIWAMGQTTPLEVLRMGANNLSNFFINRISENKFLNYQVDSSDNIQKAWKDNISQGLKIQDKAKALNEKPSDIASSINSAATLKSKLGFDLNDTNLVTLINTTITGVSAMVDRFWNIIISVTINTPNATTPIQKIDLTKINVGNDYDYNQKTSLDNIKKAWNNNISKGLKIQDKAKALNEKASVIANSITSVDTLKSKLGFDLNNRNLVTLINTTISDVKARVDSKGNIIVSVTIYTPGPNPPSKTIDLKIINISNENKDKISAKSSIFFIILGSMGALMLAALAVILSINIKKKK